MAIKFMCGVVATHNGTIESKEQYFGVCSFSSTTAHNSNIQYAEIQEIYQHCQPLMTKSAMSIE